MALPSSAVSAQEPAGSIRGVVYDRDFDAPLPAALVQIVETGQQARTTDQGNYSIADVPPGRYTLVFFKEGYVRQVKADVVVNAGKLTDLDMSLPGDIYELEEFVVQDIQITSGTEASLLALRFEAPALIDSIGAELMSRAGAGDAASGLQLVSGATVSDGKFAVVRGLPDRFVSSQLNGVRMPSADEDKRAVELDQFPSAVIESIQVSKTFTPDQQGDASGGAVDVRLKGLPEETTFNVKAQLGYNSNVTGRSDFLTYEGGGVDFWGRDDGRRDQQLDLLGENWDGAVGTTTGDAPTDYKWSVSGGGRHVLDSGVTIGGFGSFFYERDSGFTEGVNDSWWVKAAGQPGQEVQPEQKQGQADPSGGGDYKTALFDVRRGTKSVQWGALGTLGVEAENHRFGLTYLYSHTAEDKATLSEDTRGKEFFFPGHDPYDPSTPGHEPNDDAAPYLRSQALEYTERTTGSVQLTGDHRLPISGFDLFGLDFGTPELDWAVAQSFADQYQPDKRLFGAEWRPAREPIPGFIIPSFYRPLRPAAQSNLGNFQRIWKSIDEDSDQYFANLKFPFEQGGEPGYFKFGLFDDRVGRSFDQDTFSNGGDGTSYDGDFFDQFWSDFYYEDDAFHPMKDGSELGGRETDIDYEGRQEVAATYGMVDMPLSSNVNLIGGVRWESTEIGIINDPEADAFYFAGSGAVEIPDDLGPEDIPNVAIRDDRALPSIGVVYEASDEVTIRASYSETLARPTFKELTPIIQQEFAGGPIFVGNPELQLASLKNYDVRVDYKPIESSLLSLSVFRKDVEDAIEYVIVPADFSYTRPTNYPDGKLTGVEFEARQQLGEFWDWAEGVGVGANATFISSEVTLPQDEADDLASLGAPMPTRNMTQAPEHLFNLNLTYDLDRTRFGLFYTIKGDTLLAGAGNNTNLLIPNVYATEVETLNFTASHRFSDRLQLTFQAKNLTDPSIETVFRSDVLEEDLLRTSQRNGKEFSISLSFNL